MSTYLDGKEYDSPNKDLAREYLYNSVLNPEYCKGKYAIFLPGSIKGGTLEMELLLSKGFLEEHLVAVAGGEDYFTLSPHWKKHWPKSEFVKANAYEVAQSFRYSGLLGVFSADGCSNPFHNSYGELSFIKDFLQDPWFKHLWVNGGERLQTGLDKLIEKEFPILSGIKLSQESLMRLIVEPYSSEILFEQRKYYSQSARAIESGKKDGCSMRWDLFTRLT